MRKRREIFSHFLLSLLFPAVLLLFSGCAEGAGTGKNTCETVAPAAAGVERLRREYPDADYLLVSDREYITVQSGPRLPAKTGNSAGAVSDVTSVSVDEMEYLILTEKGRRELRTIPFRFNENYESVTVAELAIARGGIRTAVDPESCSAVTIDPAQMNSNIYDPAQKVLQLNLPDLQIGDTLFLTVKTRSFKQRMPGVFTDFITVQGDCPILKYRVEITVPEELELRSIAVRGPDRNKVRFEQKRLADPARIRYEWEASDMPQLIAEPNAPELYMNATRILVSSAPDWPAVSRWYFDLCRKPLAAVSPEMREFVDKLKKSAGGDPEKLKAELFAFVSQQVRYMGITPEDEAPGYEPHPVEMTFRDRAGVCRDKAALLTALFTLAGFEAYPVLFMVGSPKDGEVPNSYFNHAIAAIRNADGTYGFFDPTYENTRDYLPAYESEMSGLVATPEGDTLLLTPPVDPRKNRTDVVSKLRLDRYGTLSGAVEITLSGGDDTAYRGGFARMSEEDRVIFLRRSLQKLLKNGVITNFKFLPKEMRDTGEGVLTVAFEFAAPEFLAADGKKQELEIPDFAAVFGNAAYMDGFEFLSERRFPLELDCTASSGSETRIEFAPEIEVVSRPPEQGGAEAPAFEFKSCRNGDVLRRETVWKQRRIPIGDYPALREAVISKNRSSDRKFILKVPATGSAPPIPAPAIGRPACDVNILEASVNVGPGTDGGFAATMEKQLQVLSYHGVKTAAEQKIPYADNFAAVELLSGSVTAPSGNTRELSLGDVRIMDAPGNAAAPDHTPRKLLVVNFPAVSVGSLLELRLRRTERGFSDWHMDLPLAETRTRTEKVKIHTPERQKEFSGLKHIPVEAETAPLALWNEVEFFSVGDRMDFFEAMSGRLDAASDAGAATAAVAEQLWRDNPLDPVGALGRFAARNIRVTGPEAADTRPEEVADADAVLKRGYGNAWERAAFFAAALKSRGLDYSIRLLPATSAPLDKRPFRRNDISDVFVAADGGYLGGRSQYADFGSMPYPGRSSFALPGLTLIPPTDNGPAQITESDLDFLPDGSWVLTNSTLFRAAAAESVRAHYSELSPELKRRDFLARANETFPGGEVLFAEAADASGGFRVRLKVRGRVLSADGSHLAVPIAGSGIPIAFEPSRRNPLMADFHAWETRRRVTVPGGFRIVRLPEEADFEVGPVKFSRRVSRNGNAVEITDSGRVGHGLIAPEEIKKLGAFNSQLENSQILLEKTPNQP